MENSKKSNLNEPHNYASYKQNDKENKIIIVNWDQLYPLKEKESNKYYTLNENKSITENIFFQSKANLDYIFINNGDCSLINQKLLEIKELTEDSNEIITKNKEILDSVFISFTQKNIDFANFDFKKSIKLTGVLNKKFLKKVSCGEKHCLFLTHAGMSFSIGDNTFGQLGIGNNTYQREPVMITALLNYRVSDLNTGKFHSVAIGILRENTNSKMKLEDNNNKKDKENYLFTWGDNSFGQLGLDFDNDKNNQRSIRKSVDFENIKKNMNYNVDNDHYQSLNNINLLENYVHFMNLPHNLPVFNNKLISSIEIGCFHNLVFLSDGKVFAFGRNLENQILNIKGDSERYINEEIIRKINECHLIFLEKQDNTIIKNLYRDLLLNNYYKCQFDIKKLYFGPEKIRIPFRSEKIKIDLIKVNSNSSLYLYNDNNIYLTGKIVEKIPILKYCTIKIIEDREKENLSNEKINDRKKIDILNTINDLNNTKNEYINQNFVSNDETTNSIYNSFNFVFILNDDNFVILYEPLLSNSDYEKQNQEKFDVKIPNKTLKIEFVPIYESKNENHNNNLISLERISIAADDIMQNTINIRNSINETTVQKNHLNEKIQGKSIQYGTNNLKIKLSYNENENKSIFEDKTSNISSNLFTAGNLERNYYSDNINYKNDDKDSLDEEFSKELFTENANNDEIFDNSFSFEQSIEELRNYINLVGISLLDNGISKLVSFRPKNLPKKSAQEESYHRKLVEENRKNYMKSMKEKQEQEKKQKAIEEKKKQKAKKLYVTWVNDILPTWYKIKDDVNYLRKYFYEGVPISLRGTVWLLCIGNNFSITRDYYEIEVKKAINYLILINKKRDTKSEENADDGEKFEDNVNTPERNIIYYNSKTQKYNIQIINKENSISYIDLDIERTFPYLGIFKHNSPLSEDLREILRAFVVSRPDIGYVQGLSYIAGMLILNMDKYQAFVALMNIILNHNILPFYRFEENQIRKRLQIFKQVFYYNLPELCDLFESIDLLPETYMIEWIMTIFAKNVNLDFAARIWDIYMIDGFKVIYQTAIIILSHFEKRFMEMEFEDIVKTLKNLNKINFDEEQIIELIKKVSFPDWVSDEILKLNYEYIPL